MKWTWRCFIVWMAWGTLQAEPRESTFASFSKNTLVPWFDSQPDQFFLTLRYRIFLHPEPKADITIVHGYSERIEKLAEMAYDFHQAGYNVYLFDQRGFGRSPRINPLGIKANYVERFDDYVTDLEKFLTDVVRAPEKKRPSFIFAHSMGGLVSSLLLQKRPDLVDAAALSAPMLSIKTRNVPKKMALLLAEIAEKLGWGAHYAFGQGDPTPPVFNATTPTRSEARWRAFMEFYTTPAEWPLASGGASFHWLGEALRNSLRMEQETWIETVQTPILMFQADDDSYVDNEAQDSFCLRVRDCRKIFVPGTRHEIYRESDSARGPYLLTLLQFFEEQAWPKSGQGASQIRTQTHQNKPK